MIVGYIDGSAPPFILMAFGLAGFIGSLGVWANISSISPGSHFRRTSRLIFLSAGIVWIITCFLALIRIVMIGNYHSIVNSSQDKAEELFHLIRQIDIGIIADLCLVITSMVVMYFLVYIYARQYNAVKGS